MRIIWFLGVRWNYFAVNSRISERFSVRMLKVTKRILNARFSFSTSGHASHWLTVIAAWALKPLNLLAIISNRQIRLCQYEIEYECNFRISKHSCPQSHCSFLVLTSTEGGYRNKTSVTYYYLKHANKIWTKVQLILKVPIMRWRRMEVHCH